MASQSPAKCQFCEESSDIDFKCLNCELFLCGPCCQKIHSKIKSSKPHRIINLKDYGSEDVAASHRQVDLDHMTCPVHEGQRCISFCSQCKTAICFPCSREAHSDHKLLDIQEAYNNKVSKMKQLRTKIDTDLPFFQAEKLKLQQMVVDIQKDKDEVTKKIKDREQMFKNALSKHVDDLLSKRDEIYNESEVKIQDEVLNVQKTENELIQRRGQVNKVLESFRAEDIFNEDQLLETQLPEKIEIPVTTKVPKADFIPGEIKVVDRVTGFGDVYQIRDIQLIQTYESNLENITNILHCTKNDSTFIGSFNSEKLQQVKFKDDKMVLVKEENMKVYDMDVMDNGDILISSGNTELGLYTKDGTLKQYKDFSPLVTLGVHANKHKEILVALAEPGSIDIKPNSIRRVVVLNQRGEVIHTYEYDRDNQRIFTAPWRITTMNDNIYVSNILNSANEGRVVVLGYGGQVKWVYTGDDKQKSGVDKFYLWGITVTTSGLVLVNDANNHNIHVLSQTGDLVTCHQMNTMGIELPVSLLIDGSGYLWVGCWTRVSDKPQRAKLHKLRFC